MQHDRKDGAAELPAWMTLAEVAAWIAFGEVLPLERWPDAAAYAPTRDWGLPIADGFLGCALAARAAGRVWRRMPPPPNAWTYRARARALLRQTNDPAGLIAQLGEDERRMREADCHLSQALAEIRDAAARGRLQAWGSRRTTAGAGGKGDLGKIEASVFADASVRIYPAARDEPYFGGFVTADNTMGTDVWARVSFQGDAVAALGWHTATHGEGGKAAGIGTHAEIAAASLSPAPAIRPAAASPPHPPFAARNPPAATQAGINAWLLLEVHRWNQAGLPVAPPSLSDLLDAARLEFRGVSRDMIRTARTKNAPREWIKPGPKTGMNWREWRGIPTTNQ